MTYPKVSIVIALPKINRYILEAIPYYENLDYPDFEIIVLPDEDKFEDAKLSDKLNIRLVPSPDHPGQKRDLGAKVANGEIIAYIDDDAYPREDWLKNAVEIFNRSEQIGIVGGPGITPPNEKFWSRLSGNIYESFVMSGRARNRFYITGNEYEEEDIASVNLLVRKKVFEEVNGFSDTYDYHPGEDTIFCLKVKKAGYKLIFSPNVVVYHHRRVLFWDHFRQILNYALHRGYFVKRFPENSRKIQYFIPSAFLLGVVGGAILSPFSNLILYPYLSAMSLYFVLCIVSSIRKNPLETLLTTIGIFLSHLTYGFFFLVGLFMKKPPKRFLRKNIQTQKRFQ